MKINGETHYLWRAVDHEGEILESYVTKTRDKKAALAFMRKALRRHGAPEKITTDGCRSYGAAMDELGNRNKQEVGRHANNRVENSHLPFRRRERAMLRFRRMRSLQKFASVHANVHNLFAGTVRSNSPLFSKLVSSKIGWAVYVLCSSFGWQAICSASPLFLSQIAKRTRSWLV